MKTTHIIVAVVCCCVLLASGVDAQQAVKQETKVEYFKTPRPMALPFSDAVRVGNILYLSGEIGLDYATMKACAGRNSGRNKTGDGKHKNNP